jgi:hypothetical protein
VISESGLRLEHRNDGIWALTGPAVERFGLVNEYLGYLADRNYSPKTVRAYGYDLDTSTCCVPPRAPAADTP